MDLKYILCDEASKDKINIKGELHKYLVKVRRHNVGDELDLRAKNDLSMLHSYKISSIDPKSLELSLLSSRMLEVKSEKYLHVAWCVIDLKSIEKVLPMLNELGVSRVTFVYCERSQRNIKLDFARFERILEASMQQCGRSSMMDLDECKSIKEFLHEFDDVVVFDFCQHSLGSDANFKRVLVGCEGGFSKSEREMLGSKKSFRLETPMVLRSESAVVAICSKILL
ncbi:MAG: 16S rRNA (uracil(1498)-N(3))-methyltransferase [Sulfurimonas sp.]|uniref:16S rRNA (uracil(1498)-N(3))-methyltransferase n=1 Tax=Sulfurimonas sp. TaxID=2022749 RepID=UPI0025CD2197|nr:16S rRNA (uracil(1498)-N(3))-methyltransferase [Sulfurimonas sp.]MCK9491268.1 16S rRNA (uracil(1498)-N(3))-methyltransferase [Sulfurimonas sp.]